MAVLEEILSALKLWPKWKQIEATVDRLNELEKRVIDLEQKLARCPGEACPKCGELSFRAVSSHPHYDGAFRMGGIVIRHMKCEKCGFEEEHTVTPGRKS